MAVWEIMGSGLEMVDMKGAFKQDFHKVLPWNRRARRRVEQARGVVLHLFSGKDQSFWQDAGEVVLCLPGGEGLFVPALHGGQGNGSGRRTAVPVGVSVPISASGAGTASEPWRRRALRVEGASCGGTDEDPPGFSAVVVAHGAV